MKFSKMLVAALAASTIAGTAYAADLPARKVAPLVEPAPIFTWSGLYVGLQAGGAWDSFANGNNNNWLFVGFPFFGWNTNNGNNGGFVGGAHVGYNFQTGGLVFGLEGDVEGTSIRNSGLRASLRARLGFALDRLLIYGAGGLAVAGGNGNGNNWGWGWNNNFGGNGLGWTAGAGLEYAFAPNWSARVEYRYSEFGGNNNNNWFWGAGNSRRRENAVRVGVSYHFGGPAGAVVARY